MLHSPRMVDNSSDTSEPQATLPRSFIFRRLHSLTGAWLTIYLFYHLLVNSQAGLFFKDHGRHFIKMVNSLEDMPFLSAIELLFLGLPFLIHTVWGIIYLCTARYNSFPGEVNKPILPQYPRNRAYSWQRITSWLLIFGIAAHVIHMRFISSPKEMTNDVYVVKVRDDIRLKEDAKIMHMRIENKADALFAYAEEPGKGFLLMIRNSFFNPYLALLYSLLVWFACYHAFNGLWTFLITWGVTMTPRAQRYARFVTYFLMWITIFLGLFSIWGTYVSTIHT